MNQRELVTDYINEFGSISPMEAFSDLGITKLATVVSMMIRDGYSIRKEWEHKRNRYGKPVSYMRYSWEVSE